MVCCISLRWVGGCKKCVVAKYFLHKKNARWAAKRFAQCFLRYAAPVDRSSYSQSCGLVTGRMFSLRTLGVLPHGTRASTPDEAGETRCGSIHLSGGNYSQGQQIGGKITEW